MNQTTTNQTRHWSKQFWPWFLILLPASAVIAGMVTLTLAIQNAPIITDSEIGRFAREAPQAATIEAQSH